MSTSSVRAGERDTVSGADQTAFGELVERHRRELRVHCYRMLGSFTEAEDLVQETFLRAWRKRDTYQGRASFRAWLYRIATNACLDFLDRHPRSPVTATEAPPGVVVPWLQPYPDRLLDTVTSDEPEPEAVAVARETIELAFLAAIQHLPPRQRAVLILRDVLGWPAADTAELLDTSLAAVNSALQRARPAVRRHLPPHRDEWRAATAPSEAERALLHRYVEAIEGSDDAALRDLLRADARVSHQPGAGGHGGAEPAWYAGRETIIAAWAPLLHAPEGYAVRVLPTWANRQPAVGTYVRAPGEPVHRAIGLTVLGVLDGRVAEVASFGADLLPAFGLPSEL